MNSLDKYGLEVKTMTKIDQVYVCKTCGNKVKVVGEGFGTLVCCGKPMTLEST